MALAVKSSIKTLVKKYKMRISGDFWKALDERITWKVQRASDRAKANGRKPLRAADL